MIKKAKILGSTSRTVKMECPNCGESVLVAYSKNKWTECFQGSCWTCGWKFMLRDTDFAIVQPDSPFFKMIYNFHPEKEAEKNKKIAGFKESKRKEELQKKYWEERYDPLQKHVRFRVSERRAIEKEVLKED